VSSSPTPAKALDAITAIVELGPGSHQVAATEGTVWVPILEEGTLARIDPETNEVVAVIDVGAAAAVAGDPTSPRMDVVVAEGDVWLTASIGKSAISATPSLLRIDSATNAVVDTYALSVQPTLVTFGEGSVWVTSYRGAVLRVDPATGETTATITIDTANAITIGADAVWVASDNESTISRIDPTTNEIVATIQLSGFITDVEASDDVLWASVAGPEGPSDLVLRIDPTTNAVVATIPLAGAGDLVLDGADLWAVSAANAAIAHIDTAANQITALYQSGLEDFWSIDVEDGVIWVANPFAGTVTRIDP
jgi:streptogramin lyase